MRHPYVLFTLTALAAACGSSAPPTTGPAAGPDLVAAKASAETSVRAHLDTVATGDIDAFVASLTPEVTWFGSAATEAMVGRDKVKADLDQVFGPVLQNGGKLTTQITPLGLGVAPDGRGAWAAHTVTLTISGLGDPMTVPYRVTSVMSEDGGAWSIVAQHWSVGLPDEQAFALAAQGLSPAPAPVGDDVASAAAPVAALFRTQLQDAAAWVAGYSDRDDALAIGSAPEEHVAGGKAIKEAFGALVAKYQVRLAASGGLRAGVVASGSVAWVATNLDFTATVDGTAITQPYRALVVYVNEGGVWTTVQSHFSSGQPGA